MSKKFKVGIVGMGRIGRSSFGTAAFIGLPDLFELTAIADHAPDRLENLPEKYGNPQKFNSLEEMLEKSDIEIVGIGTRHPDHVPMAIKSLEAGRHVYVEKPCATSVRELELLHEAEQKSGKKVFFGHIRHFEAAYQKALTLINAGEIGKVEFIKLDRSVGFSRRNDWMTMTEFYGGLLTNWGPHLIDQALTFLDSPVKDIWADVRRIVSIGDGDDFFKILLKGENGRTADIEVTGANQFKAHELEIIGNRGTLVYPVDGKIWIHKIDPAVELKDLKPHSENPPMQYGNFDEKLFFVESKYDVPEIPGSRIWQHVYDCLTKGTPFPITYEQAKAVVEVTEKVFEISGFEPIKKYKSKTC